MATDQPDRGLRGLPGGKQKYSAFALARKAMNYHQDWQRAWRDAPPQSEYDVAIIGGGTTRTSGVGDTLILDASTIDAATARQVGEAAAELRIDFMDTPVSGGVAAAAAGTLAFMCGGSAAAFDRAKPILEGMGSPEKIFHAGPAGAGQVAKAANNMLLAVHMIGTSEALAMGEAHGLDPAVLAEIMKASSGNNWSLQVYNPWPDVMEGVPSSNNYQPGFMVDLMVKDLGLACEVAENCGVDNQMGKQAMAAYSAHQGEGNGPRDFSSILEWVKAQ